REGLLLDPGAVDLGAVGGPQVDEEVVLALAADFGVAAADVAVLEHDVALGLAADRDRLVTDSDPAPVRKEQRPGGVAPGAGDDFAGDEELALPQGVVGRQLD